MEKLSEYIEARNEVAFENVEFSTNKIIGTISFFVAKAIYQNVQFAFCISIKIQCDHCIFIFYM